MPQQAFSPCGRRWLGEAETDEGCQRDLLLKRMLPPGFSSPLPAKAPLTASASPRSPRLSLERRYSLLGMILIAPTVLILCAVIVYPLVAAIYLSLFSIYTPTLQGNWVGLGNYAEVLGSRGFWSAARARYSNSSLVMSMSWL